MAEPVVAARRALLLAALTAHAVPGRAQPAYPSRPITLVVPFAPGGIADLSARVLAEAMGPLLGQPVVVENKPGAGNVIGSQAVAQARADGHTLLLISNGNAVSVSLFRKLPFDIQRDFAPIGLIGSFELGLFVAPGSRYTTWREWLAQARARPGTLTVGTISPGSTQHLTAELLKSGAAIDVLIVPYKGTPALLAALRSGEIDLAVEILGPMLGQVAGGGVRVLATTGESRHAALPTVATVRESGLAGFQVASWNGLAAPAATPPAVLEALGQALRTALGQSATRERLARLGVRVQPGTPAQLRELLGSEIARWSEVVRQARLEPAN